MKPNDIIIDPEIQALIPPLREEERALLEESLRTEGCRERQSFGATPDSQCARKAGGTKCPP